MIPEFKVALCKLPSVFPASAEALHIAHWADNSELAKAKKRNKKVKIIPLYFILQNYKLMRIIGSYHKINNNSGNGNIKP